MIIIPGYRDLERIYESANSRIYRCRREQDDLPIILKLLREDYPSAHELIRYRQEYKITRLLSDRPGIIQTLGMGEHGSTCYIVVEDFGADSLKSWAEKRSFTLTEKLSLAMRMAASIGEAHAAHVIHKDVNLANFVYHPETDTLKLIDFGISTQLTRECPEIRSPNVLEGTLAYISPEQTGRMNRAIDYRTDFYSLGAALYQLFTDWLPFETDDQMELVHCHLARQPALPHKLVPEIPEMVSAILMKLMAKTPEERYQSTAGIQTDLQTCLEDLQKMGRVQSFALGQGDFPESLLIPQKLYGREPELSKLLGAFDRVATGGKELMMVAGHSGIGKTALVQELFKPMTERRGYFVSGKFDQLKRDLPYRALAEAFRQLIRQLLTLPEEQLGRWRQALCKALGPNGKVVVEVIPDLELVIGPQPAVDEVGPQESQNRFNYVFQNFLQAIADPSHPLILFIDDLQWADSASLKLLKLILTTPEIQHLHLIAAYRDNEVSPTHPWMLTVKEVGEAGCRIELVSLGPLTVQLVNELLTDALRGETGETLELARLVHEKTQGNPFFVAAFLHALDKNGLLILDRKTGAWRWDLRQIRALGITDNVVDLMVASLRRLEPQTQQTLSLAACIGNRFDLSTLAVVCESALKQTLALLQPALAEGFVLPQDQEYKAVEHDVLPSRKSPTVGFKFAHDRIQQAAYALISENQRKPVHWKIGKLLQKAGADPIDIANHLDFSAADLTHPQEKEELASLNLQAGRKAKASAAYAQADVFLTTARRLMGEAGWGRVLQLTREISEEAADSAYLVGDYARAESLAGEVERHTGDVLEKVNACKLRILCHVALDQPAVAVDTGVSFLGSLGCRFPREPGLLRVGWELFRLKRLLSHTDIPALASLPEMTDAGKSAAVMMINLIAPATLFCRPKLFALLACQGARLVIAHGRSPSYSFTPLAMVITSTLGDPRTGLELGELAVRMASQAANRRMKCRVAFVVNTYLKHWRVHLRETTQALREAVQVGADSGDFEFAAYAAQGCCLHRLLLGEGLSELEPEMISYRALAVRFGQNIPLAWIDIYHQCSLRLLGRPEEPYRLLDKVKDERTFLEHQEKSELRIGVVLFHFFKLLLGLIFQGGQEALTSALRCEKHIESSKGSFLFARFYFFASLAFLEAARESNRQEFRKLHGKVRQNLRKLRGWAKQAPMNHLHAVCLVEAERCRVLGRPKKAMGLYQRSIELAREHGWVHEEGLACELAGRFYLEREEDEKAASHLKAARLCYVKWGAVAKVEQMDEVYGALLAKRKEEAPAREGSTVIRTATIITTTKSITTSLDLRSILKASQTISGEIELSRLLETLMRIIQENAGAERVGLVLKSGEGFVVEGVMEGVMEGAEQNQYRLLGVPLEQCEELPVAMVRFVIRAQESLVLGDATRQGAYVSEPYVVQRRPRSVLCCPILRHKGLIGVLYLENNQTAEAFTPDRVELLGMLASQAAISIENARLFTELQQALAQARESMRVKREFLAKTSHELRTPLNAIINIPRNLTQNYVDVQVLCCEACEAKYEYTAEMDTTAERCPGCGSVGQWAVREECLYEGDPREARSMMDRVARSGECLLQVVNNILEIAEIEDKRSELTLGPIRLDELLSRVVELIGPTAQGKRIDLRLLEVPAQRTIRADFAKLGQVLYNLIDNAIKFSPKGGTVQIGTKEEPDDVVLFVQDHGIGIARENYELIFESFRQVDEGETRDYGGAGLGLSVARSLVELHGGKIWVESELGQGSTFFVQLPVPPQSKSS